MTSKWVRGTSVEGHVIYTCETNPYLIRRLDGIYYVERDLGSPITYRDTLTDAKSVCVKFAAN